MLRFILRRVIQAVITLWAVVTVTFFMVANTPGNPFGADKNLNKDVLARLHATWGLDQPQHVQYWRYLKSLAAGDLAVSMKYEGRTVKEIIRDGFPVSLRLGLFGLCIALIVGVPTGVLAAARKNTLWDYGPMALAMLGICLPTFVLGPMLALIFGLKLELFNVAGLYEKSDYFLPSLTLGLVYGAYIARLTRGGMLEALSQDFVRTARAKGASGTRIVLKHALKPGLQPLISYLGPAIIGLVTGSVVTEVVFQIPGLGQHFVDAAKLRDQPLLLGLTVFYSALLIAANLAVDLIQAALNPRVRLET